MEQRYDLIIVGGGMVGASLAIALSGHGLKLALVESAELKAERVLEGNEPAKTPINYDDRAIALAYGAQRIFSALGAWDRMAPRAEAIRHIHVSEQGGFGFAHLDAAEEGVPALGYVITARDLGAALLDKLATLDDVALLAPARVAWVRMDEEQAVIGIDGNELATRLLVAADGGHSFIRDQLCFETRHKAYGQSAVIANLTPGRPHRGTAYECFTRNGPLAMLPMSDERCALVWTVRDDQLDDVLELDDAQFLARIQDHFGWRLGRFSRVGRRTGYPLTQTLVRRSTRPRAAIIGNAAHTLHPVAGQGFNLGLRDVAALAQVVLEGRRNSEDPGSEAVLQRYEAWRSRDQQQVARITDSLIRIFSNDFPPLRLGRNLGLLTVELCPPVRHKISRAAMGIEGRLPRLSRGVPL